MGSFGGLGAEPPDCRRLSEVQGPQVPAGVRGAVIDVFSVRIT